MRTLSDKYNFYRSISGFCMAFNEDDSPFIITIDGQVFVPLFSSAEKLKRFLEEAEHTDKVQVKQIQSQMDFMQSVVMQGCKVMLDPHGVDGKTRFTELMLE